ncbi:MAG: 4-diphosphocytidyl-2-C-methyl-D-erythritol kinase [Chlamydiae bacterium]|nr:4-diphosphocytidyl-2-C-methyl-D-erythritol kinase [Chlamydiota bacterium]
MASSLSLFSPAKLNLFFRVLSKREEGYHEIASLYQAINLGDTLSIDFAEGDSLTCSDPTLPVDETNLVLRALDLFRKKTKIKKFFQFSLSKRIPIEAGLGGGSSNAATTLWGLNHLMQLGINDVTLAEWGKELGADVPFFLSLGTAYCEGIGEILTHLPSAEAEALWVAKPRQGLSTARVFQGVDFSKVKKRDPRKTLQRLLDKQDSYYNDLEHSAFALLPSLKVLKKNLESLGFSHVQMTGSGTSFFCMGSVRDPKLPAVTFFPVKYLSRAADEWYKFPG